MKLTKLQLLTKKLIKVIKMLNRAKELIKEIILKRLAIILSLILKLKKQ